MFAETNTPGAKVPTVANHAIRRSTVKVVSILAIMQWLSAQFVAVRDTAKYSHSLDSKTVTRYPNSQSQPDTAEGYLRFVPNGYYLALIIVFYLAIFQPMRLDE